jgi:hypothetical protein
MEPHQKALVDQAIRLSLTRYDEQHCLLRTSADPRFRAVQETLAFAALLLARTAAGNGRKTELGLARLLVDTILPLQNRVRRDPGRGAFPLLWTPDAKRAQVMDPDSPEIMGSLLGVMHRDFSHLLGEKRSARVLEAIKFAIRDKDQSTPETTSGAMIAAWLELEFNDHWRGERLATDVALAGLEALAERRFGDPAAYARELWALGLWRRSTRLHDSVEGLLPDLLEEIGRFAHPGMPEVFGSMTSGTGSASAYPRLGAWLTWHALAGEPMLPKTMSDPLDATCFAFPALARAKIPAGGDATQTIEPHPLCQSVGDRQMTGWMERDLHLEARSVAQAEAGRLPVAGVRWRTLEGTTAWLRCRVSRQQRASCKKRFVHLEDPGNTIVSVHDLGQGETRMIENGWWLSGLHFATEGFQMLDARRSDEGLELTLKPTSERTLLMFSPLS